VRWLIMLAAVGIVVVAIIAGSVSHKPTEAELARAQRRYEKSVAACIERGRVNRDAPAGTSVKDLCRERFSEADFLGNDGLKLDDLDEYVLGPAFIVMLIGLVIGASMVGAAWQAGTITTTLTWEPRRIRWFVSRVFIVAVGVAAVATVLMALLAVALAVTTTLRGSTATSTPWLRDVALTIARIAGVSAAIGVIGAAVAMIGRHTAAALGAVFVYMAVLESIVRGLRPGLGRLLLGDNIGTVLTATTTELYQGESIFRLTPQHGAFVIALYVVGLVGAALVLLRARDVN
jgi:hypothetical protein